MFKATLKSDNLKIPRICPNCLAPATTLYHEGFWGFGFEKVLAPPARYRCGSFFYCDYCGTQYEKFDKISRHLSCGVVLMTTGFSYCHQIGWLGGHLWLSAMVFVALLLFLTAIGPFARWIVRRKYPPREGQAVFSRPAAKSDGMFGEVTFRAARQEWLKELANLNENSMKAAT